MKPLVNKTYLLEKFNAKGGWTYAAIPDVMKGKDKPFGWVKVKGSIDGVEISKYSLMPMGNGKLFLPVKQDIRKKIGKQAGDHVHIILYPDTDPLEIPGEFLLCLEDDPKALRFFNSLSENEQKYYIQWIYTAKRDETKTDRMARSVDRLARALKFHEQ